MVAAVATRSIDHLVIRGKSATGDLADRITAAHVSLSAPLQGDAYSVSQLTFTVSDPNLKIWSTHLFDLGATVDLGALYCRVAESHIDEPLTGPEIVVVARSEGSEKLSNQRGYQTWEKLSPSDVAVHLGEAAGLRVVAQPSPTIPLIYRREPDITVPGDRGESSWQMLGRYAKAEGFVLFEAYGILYFGKPSWLVVQLQRISITWNPTQPPDDLLQMPSCRRTQDGYGRDVREVTLRVTSAVAARITPGMALDLAGIERFSTTYLISGVEFDVIDGGEGTITAVLPTDPLISPTDSADVAETITPAGTPMQGGTEFGKFVNAISGQESGGSYSEVNARTGALGRYQVLPSNVPAWSKSILGHAITPSEFLHNPKLQDQIAVGVLWTYYSVHGARGAAAAWYSGDPTRQNDTRRNPKYPNEPSVSEYADAIVAKMKTASGTLPAGYTGAGSAVPTVVTGPRKSAAQFVFYAQSQVDDHTPYRWGAKAASTVVDPTALDCSGLTAWAAGRCGAHLPDGARQQWQFCRAQHMTITIDEAYRTLGALLFRIDLLTGDDHVVISMGDGKRTIEAMGRKYGVVDGNVLGRGWTAAALVPGISYSLGGGGGGRMLVQ